MTAHNGSYAYGDGSSDTDFSTLVGAPDFQSSAPASIGSAAPTNVLYLTEIANTPAVAVTDINQGQIGDCFLLSSIGEIALLKPSFISSMIKTNSNGTETVTLYEAKTGSLPAYNTTSFKSVTETLTNAFPTNAVNSGATQDVVGGYKEIWPQVLEKAVAQLDGGYSKIANGGSPLVAMEELTGKATSFMAPAGLALASLITDANAGDMIMFDTKGSGGLTNGLFNDHAYMFDGVTGSGAAATVKLLNPWGFDEPTPVLFSNLSKNFAEVDIGHIG